MHANPNENPLGLSRAAEWLMVIALCLTFGFVMFDRFALANLSGFVLADLGIGATELGAISSAFAIAWGIAGYFGGLLADMSKSKKKLLIICILIFSASSFATGLAQGFISLMLIRVVMGIVEGPVLPLVQSINIAGSTPTNRGLNQGIVQVSAVGLISSLLGPIICVALESWLGWRGAFYFTAIPGVIVAILAALWLKEPVAKGGNVVEGIINKDGVAPQEAEAAALDTAPVEKASLKEAIGVAKNRNVLLALIAACFILFWYLNVLTFTPTFLTIHRGFSPAEMSVVMSCFGVGAIVWGAVMPKISDVIGRRPTLAIACVMACIANLGLLLADSYVVICVCCFIGWAGASVSGMFQGTVPSEAVDPKYATSALGLVQCVGELIGGGVGGVVCGMIIDGMGYDWGMWIMMFSIILVIVFALLLKETAPAVVAKKAAKKAA